jgi:hypothetical protein
MTALLNGLALRYVLPSLRPKADFALKTVAL